MTVPAPDPIETTDTLVRLYVFLTQYLDRCLDEAARQSFPEQELRRHLTDTRTKLDGMLAVNPVVRNKVEQECERILSLGAACLKQDGAAVRAEVPRERAVLRSKTLALSDLLAVFRAQKP
jgi:hypothetical protein